MTSKPYIILFSLCINKNPTKAQTEARILGTTASTKTCISAQKNSCLRRIETGNQTHKNLVLSRLMLMPFWCSVASSFAYTKRLLYTIRYIPHWVILGCPVPCHGVAYRIITMWSGFLIDYFLVKFALFDEKLYIYFLTLSFQIYFKDLIDKKGNIFIVLVISHELIHRSALISLDFLRHFLPDTDFRNNVFHL